MLNKKSESGVSQGIRKTMISHLNETPLISNDLSKEFTIKIANCLEERESTFQLAYHVYLEKGFISTNYNEWLVQNYDANKDTVILIVQDKIKRIAGSLTLVFGSTLKLPAEKIYGDEIKNLKLKGEKIMEVSRLVISPEYRNAKEVLKLLFNYMLIYSYHVMQYTSMIIEVNPRHKMYYKTLLKYDEIGEEKACPSVQNAPAVLLHLPFERYQSELKQLSNNPEGKNRSLYPYFIKPEQEMLVAQSLQKQFKPMTMEEKMYFGFTESGINRAVSV